MKQSRDLPLVACFTAVALAGIALLLWLTPQGAGVSPDSTVYIAAAGSLLRGQGYSYEGVPVAHFPPLYTALLAAAAFLQNDLTRAAADLNAVLLGLNLVLVAVLVFRATKRSLLVTLMAALFFISSEPLVELHAWAWSEPLFIALLLVGILWLAAYIGAQRPLLLVASALALGLAILARYVGFGLLPAGAALVFLADRPRDRLKQLGRSLLWLALALLPIGLFFLRNRLLLGSFTDRGYALHPIPVSDYVVGLTSTLSRLIAPDPTLARLGVALIAIVMLYLVLSTLLTRQSIRMDWRSPDFAIPACCILFSVCFILFLYASICFLDSSTPLDARVLSPVLIMLIVGGFSLTWSMVRLLGKPAAWWAVAAVMLLLILARVPAEAASLAAIREDGLGYASREWINSETVQAARSLPAEAMLYSNAPDVMSFLVERRAVPLPVTADSMTRQPNPHYADDIGAMCADLMGGRAYLVHFELIESWNRPKPAELGRRCQLHVLEQLNDGAIYGSPGN